MAKKTSKPAAPVETKSFDDFIERALPPEMTSLQVEVNKELFEEAKKYKGVEGYTWTTVVEAGLRAFIHSCEVALEKRLKGKS